MFLLWVAKYELDFSYYYNKEHVIFTYIFDNLVENISNYKYFANLSIGSNFCTTYKFTRFLLTPLLVLRY